MRDRPILFNGQMVRAILEGRKTQTRRLMKLPPYVPADCKARAIGQEGMADVSWSDGASSRFQVLQCPYGAPGDRLWVRETCIPFEIDHVSYAADFLRDPKGEREHGVRWTPSIHMPRWASRITLEITGVRVERLRDISEADAKAEGVELPIDSDGIAFGRYYTQFAELWSDTYGLDSWHASPWVWVIEFVKTEDSNV